MNKYFGMQCASPFYRMRQSILAKAPVHLSIAPVHYIECASPFIECTSSLYGRKFKFREFKQNKTSEVNEARGGAPRLLLTFVVWICEISRVTTFPLDSNQYNIYRMRRSILANALFYFYVSIILLFLIFSIIIIYY